MDFFHITNKLDRFLYISFIKISKFVSKFENLILIDSCLDTYKYLL